MEDIQLGIKREEMKVNDTTQWRDKLELEYKEKHFLYNKFCSEIVKQLEEILSQANISTAFPIESREKSWTSICEKCERDKITPKNLDEIEDIAGVRVILLFIRDLDKTCGIIEENFKVLKKEDITERLEENKFGYSSIHYILTPPKGWFSLPSLKDLKGFKAEVQVRTASQHIWAAASHILQYKREKDVPIPLQRSINRAAALLETVDLEFERVLSERGLYIKTIEKVKDEALNTDSLRKTLERLLPKENLFLHDKYSELLVDLGTFGVTKVKELEEIIKNSWDRVKEEEASLFLARKEEFEKNIPLTGTSKARIRKGVFYTHVGLTRVALRVEFGKQFEDYMRDGRQPSAA